MSNWNEQSKTAWNESWSNGNGMGSAMSLVSGIGNVVGAGFSNAQVKNTDIYNNQLRNFGKVRFNQDNFDNLINDYSSNIAPDMPGWDKLTGSTGEKLGNTLSATASGAMTGLQVGGPWGALAGAIIGLGAGVGGWIIGDTNAQKEAERLNTTLEETKLSNALRFNSSAATINDKMFNSASLNYRAYGGDLYDNAMVAKHFNDGKVKRRKISYIGNMFAYGGPMKLGGDWTNGVTIIGEGGTHEMNPYDGVQVGIDDKGVPNLVEEGEVIFNDYVYSNRLKPTEKQLDEVKLDKDFEGLTFAEAAKKISKESEERPNDPISKNGLIDGMIKLQAIQEEIREKKAAAQFKRQFNKLSPEEQQAVAMQMMQPEGNVPMEETEPEFNFEDRYAANGNPQEQLGEEYGFANGGEISNRTTRRYKNPTKARLLRDNLINEFIKYDNQKLGLPLEFLKDLGHYGSTVALSTFSDKYNNRLNKENLEIDERFKDFSSAMQRQYDERGYYDPFDYGTIEPSVITSYNPLREGEEEYLQNNTKANGGNLFAEGDYLPILSKEFQYYKDGKYDQGYLDWLNSYDIKNSEYWNFLSKLYKDTFNKELTETEARRLGRDSKGNKTYFGNFHKIFGDAYTKYLNSKQSQSKPTLDDLVDRFNDDNIFLVDGVDYYGKNGPITLEYYDDDEPSYGKRGQIDFGNSYADDVDLINAETPKKPKTPTIKQEDKITTPSNRGEWLRYAPAIGSGIQYIADLFGANRPDYSKANMIGDASRRIRTMRAPQLYNYLRFNPYDVNYQQNRLQNVGLGTQRNILNTTSGNRAAALAALLLGNSSTISGMGDMYRTALEYNDNQRKTVSDFNRGTDQVNLQSILSAEQANQNADIQRANFILQQAKMMDEIDTITSQATSSNRSNFYKNLGNIGNDNYYKNQADRLIKNGTIPPGYKHGGKIRKPKRMI